MASCFSTLKFSQLDRFSGGPNQMSSDEIVTKLKRQKPPKRVVVNYQINDRGTVMNDKTMARNAFQTMSVNLSNAEETKRRRSRLTGKL